MKSIKKLLLFCFFVAYPLISVLANSGEIILSKEFIYEKAPFVECHASSIEVTPDGLVAAWFGGPREGNKDVEIWISHYKNQQWTTPVSIADGVQHESKRYPCWNPVLFQVPDGDLLLFYKVGPKPSKWWGMMKRSSDGGDTWGEAERLPEDVLGPIKNRPFLTSDGRLICPSSTEVSPSKGWRLHFEITPDFGKSWMLTPSISDPSNLNAIQPSILMHGNDNVLQAIARSKDGGLVDSWSYNGGRTWSELKSTCLPNPNSGTDAVTLKEGFHILIYNHTEKPKDKWSGPRTPLNLGVSANGVEWYNVIELETEPGEYSYPAVIQDKDGKVHITYTWKRRKIRHVVVDPLAILNQNQELKRQVDKQKEETEAKKVVPVIFDTDMGNDIDDALALSMLYHYQDQKLINLLGITINKANPYTKPFIDIMNRTYNVSKTPIGYIGEEGPTPEDGKYLRPVVEAKDKRGRLLFKSKVKHNTQVLEAYKLQRKLLANQKDNSVILISVGFSSNLRKLMESEADEYSSLSGMELISKKIRYLSVMAGNFSDSTKAEYNIVKDISSAQQVFDRWPTKIIAGGWEVGAAIKYPATSILHDFDEKHPLRIGYENYRPMPYDRETWDLLSVLITVEDYSRFFSLSEPGRVTVNDKGGTVFKKGINGLHQYLIVNKENKKELLETLIKAVTGNGR